MTWPQKKLFSGSVSLQNRKKQLSCNVCRKSLRFRVCLSRQLTWTLEILVSVKLDKKCWLTENYLWKLCQKHRKHSEQGLWITEQFALWKDQGLALILLYHGLSEFRSKNEISQELYVAPWNQSKGQLKTLVINFTANQKSSYSTKPASLLNLFFWWNQRKVHPNMIISIMAQFFGY